MEFYMNWITTTKIYMKMLELEHYCRFLYFTTAEITRLDLHISV